MNLQLEETQKTPERDKTTSLRQKRQDAVNAISFAIQKKLSSGETAELRRMDTEESPPPVFWKICVAYLDELLPSGGVLLNEEEKRWAAIISGLAILQDYHRPGARLGEALAFSGFSEIRFERFLRGRGNLLFAEIKRVARFLKAKAQPVDWTDMAKLLFSENEEYAEGERRNIARSYYKSIKND